MPDLTRTQRAALADLEQRRRLWPAGRGRYRHTGAGPYYSKATLAALVDHGLARWEHRPGVMPHIVHADEPEPTPAPQRRTPRDLIDRWRTEAARLDGTQDPDTYDPEGEANEAIAAVLRECADELARIVS